MAANYHRTWVRFRNPETKRKLQALRREMEEKAEKKISTSQLVEKIVEQFLEKFSPVELEE